MEGDVLATNYQSVANSITQFMNIAKDSIASIKVISAMEEAGLIDKYTF